MNLRAALACGVAGLGAWYAALIARTSFTVGATRYFPLLDDAMVSMRYARHLVQGHGLTWNLGDPPLEGFTNPLWTLVMAAYNSGEPRVMEAVVKNGRANFWEIYNKQLLPKETCNYVPKILAAIEVASRAGQYGFTTASDAEAGH